MKNKIIEVKSDSCKEVLLTIVRPEGDGEDYVEITAWHHPSNPYGCLPTKHIYIGENGFHQWDITGETVEF